MPRKREKKPSSSSSSSSSSSFPPPTGVWQQNIWKRSSPFSSSQGVVKIGYIGLVCNGKTTMANASAGEKIAEAQPQPNTMFVHHFIQTDCEEKICRNPLEESKKMNEKYTPNSEKDFVLYIARSPTSPLPDNCFFHFVDFPGPDDGKNYQYSSWFRAAASELDVMVMMLERSTLGTKSEMDLMTEVLDEYLAQRKKGRFVALIVLVNKFDDLEVETDGTCKLFDEDDQAQFAYVKKQWEGVKGKRNILEEDKSMIYFFPVSAKNLSFQFDDKNLSDNDVKKLGRAEYGTSFLSKSNTEKKELVQEILTKRSRSTNHPFFRTLEELTAHHSPIFANDIHREIERADLHSNTFFHLFSSARKLSKEHPGNPDRFFDPVYENITNRIKRSNEKLELVSPLSNGLARLTNIRDLKSHFFLSEETSLDSVFVEKSSILASMDEYSLPKNPEGPFSEFVAALFAWEKSVIELWLKSLTENLSIDNLKDFVPFVSETTESVPLQYRDTCRHLLSKELCSLLPTMEILPTWAIIEVGSLLNCGKFVLEATVRMIQQDELSITELYYFQKALREMELDAAMYVLMHVDLQITKCQECLPVGLVALPALSGEVAKLRAVLVQWCKDLKKE